MATICPYKGRRCVDCPHYRFDEDYGEKACWVKQDLAEEKRMLEILKIKKEEDK